MPLPLRLLVLCLAILVPPLRAATLNVGPGQPYSTIQSAINAAAPGDTVLVAPGTYYENLLVQNKSIALKSIAGAATTIIDGGRHDVTLQLSDTPDLTMLVTGFTFRGGGTPISPSNGGITLFGFATITDNIIQNNYGYGISVLGGTADILNNHISTVSPTAGQPQCYIYAQAGISVLSSAGPSTTTTTKTHISGNLIEGDGTFCSGSGVIASVIVPVLIENNTIRGTDIAIGVSDLNRADEGPHVVVRQNLIYNNRNGGLAFDYFPFYGSTPYGKGPATIFATNNTLYNNITSGAMYTSFWCPYGRAQSE